LVWQGEEVDQYGEEYHLFVIEEYVDGERTGVSLGVPERSKLRVLREVANGTRVYLDPQGAIPTAGGREMLNIVVFIDKRKKRGGDGGGSVDSRRTES
jgi:hypothetical protein